MNLYPFQREIVDRVRAEMLAGHKKILVVSPTGSGKTVLTADMFGAALSKGFGSWFVVHRRELVRQSITTFGEADIPHGVIAAGFPRLPEPLVQIGMVQTMGRRHKTLAPPRLIVIDEAHHMAASTWANLVARYPDAFLIGLTATPERLDGKGLGKWFDVMVEGPGVEWLIENKFLCPYKIFAPPGLNTSAIKTQMGDFNRRQLAAAAMDGPTITGDAIGHYILHGKGKRALCRGVSIEHSKHIASQFDAVGIPARHVDGETAPRERDEAMASFRLGETLVLTNVDLFAEGVDVPAAEIAIDLRPTQSLTLWLQFCGRVLRYVEGKEAVILDHAGNCMRHGLPDQGREWSLEGRDKKRSEVTGPPVRLCPNCFAAMFSLATVCKHCGHVFAAQPREVEEVEGSLEEIDKETIALMKKDRRKSARSLEALVAVGVAEGYSSPERWAEHVMAGRKKARARYAPR